MSAALLAMMLSAANASPCDTAQTTRTTVEAIASDPDSFVGRCVEIVGYSDGRALFASRDGLGIKNLPENQTRESLRRKMVGVYELPTLSDALRKQQWESGLKWHLVGKVDLCAAMYDRARNGVEQNGEDGEFTIVMMTGYCHYLDGPVLLVAHGNILDEH